MSHLRLLAQIPICWKSLAQTSIGRLLLISALVNTESLLVPYEYPTCVPTRT